MITYRMNVLMNHFFVYSSILLLLFLYLWSHTHVLVSIIYTASIFLSPDNHVILIQDKIDFDLKETIRLTWNSSAYLLSILITLFSGIFPYLKLIIITSYYYYFINLDYIYNKRAVQILRLLEFVNKFALLDIFFIGYILCIFNWDNTKPVYQNIYLDIKPECNYALLTFIIAIILTNLLTSFVLRRIESDVYNGENTNNENYVTISEKKSVSFIQKIKYYVSKLNWLFKIISLILLIIGLQESLFTVQIKALTLVNVESQYSLIGLINFLTSSKNWGLIIIGNIFLIGIYLYIQLIITKKRKYLLTECLSVILFSGIVTLYQTDTITKSISVGICNSECFQSETIINNSFWIIISCYILTVVTILSV